MNFPEHLIDPKKKDKSWHVQFCRAAWAQRDSLKMFYPYAKKYEEIADYIYGTESNVYYKRSMHIDEQTNESAAVLDFDGPKHLKKYRQDCISYLAKNEFNIEAEMIDSLARDERDEHFAGIQAKMMMRQELQKVNPELADAPQLRSQAGEPLDEMELEMVKQYGYKSELAKESEMGVELIFLQNSIDQVRYGIKEKMIDNGVAVVKDWMEPDGKIKFRLCDNRNIITNYCRYPDFRDMQYCGEVIELTWTQFVEQSAGQFPDSDLQVIFEQSKKANGWGTMARYNDKDCSKYKIKVLDLEWFSVDEQSYREKTDKAGNLSFAKTTFTATGGEKTAVTKVRYQNVYRAKWLVDTEFIYDWGRMPFQKVKGYTNAELSYHVRATNFHNMKATGITEDVLPIAKQLKIAWLKIQNVLSSMPTHIVNIDVGALESVDYSKGGANLTPTQLIKMFFQQGILVSRQNDVMTQNSGFKAIEFLATNFGQVLSESYNHFANLANMMREAMGLNDVTIGNPNAKNLNSTNEAALQATSNALYHVAFAEEKLLLELAYSVLTRLKRAVKMGKVEGYVPALGTGTMEFFRLSPDVCDREIGLKFVNQPTAEERQFLQTLMAKGMQDGTLDATDMIMVRRCHNLKQQEEILAYRIKRRAEEKQQMAMQNTQQTIQGQIQSAQAAEQAKQATLAMEYQLKMQLAQMEKEWDYKIKELELGVKHKMNLDNIQSTEKQAGMTPTPEPNPMEEQGEPVQGGPMDNEMAEMPTAA